MIRKLFVFVAALGAFGCLNPQDSTGVGNPGLTTSEQALYDDGEEGRKDNDVAASVVAIPLFRLIRPDLLASPDLAASIAEGAPNAFTPGACATASRAGTVVTYTFNDCNGPFGLASVTGKVVATFSAGAAPGSVTVTIKSVAPFSLERLKRNGFDPMKVEATIDATALVSFDGTTQRIEWNATYTGTNELGVSLVHQPSFVSTYDSATQCFTAAGNATTTVTGKPVVTTTVTGYRRCGPKTACPLPGGRTTLTRAGVSLTIEFLGGQRVRVSPPGRPPFETDKLLRCIGS